MLNQNCIKESFNISIKTSQNFLKQKNKQIENVSKLQSSDSSSSNSLFDSSSSSSDEEENKCSSFFFTSSEEINNKKLTEKNKANSNSFDRGLEANKSNNFNESDDIKTNNSDLTITQKTNNSNLNVCNDLNIEKSTDFQNEKLNNLNQFKFNEDCNNFTQKLKTKEIEDNFEIIKQEKKNFKLNDINNETTKSLDNLYSNSQKDPKFCLSTFSINSTKNAINNQNEKDQFLETNVFLQNNEKNCKEGKNELLQKISEEEETAVMSLNDYNCFGTSYPINKFADSNCIKIDKIPINSVNLINKKVVDLLKKLIIY